MLKDDDRFFIEILQKQELETCRDCLLLHRHTTPHHTTPHHTTPLRTSHTRIHSPPHHHSTPPPLHHSQKSSKLEWIIIILIAIEILLGLLELGINVNQHQLVAAQTAAGILAAMPPAPPSPSSSSSPTEPTLASIFSEEQNKK
jgi:hypothetical protein